MYIGQQLGCIVAEPVRNPVPQRSGAPATRADGNDADRAGRLVETPAPAPDKNGRAAAPLPVSTCDV